MLPLGSRVDIEALAEAFEIKGLRHGIRATNFSVFILRETVFSEIGFSVCSQNARK